jgi:prepilin peptidase CpaA
VDLMSNAPMVVATVGFYAIGTTTLLFAALHDVAFRTIPNWPPALLFGVGILMRVQSGTLVPGLLAGFLILTGTTICWLRGWLGGGDVKLLAACGMLVPPALAMSLLLAVALSGGLLAILYLALAKMVSPITRSRPAGLIRRVCRVERYRIRHRGPLPYGSAIAAGTLFVLLRG